MLFVVRDNQAWGRENIGRNLAGNERTCASEMRAIKIYESLFVVWKVSYTVNGTWQSGSTKSMNLEH